MATKPTTKTETAKDLLKGLTAGKKAATKKAQASRPEMALSPAVEQTFKRFIGASALAEIVEARVTQEKESLDEVCFQEWTEHLWKQKNRPANPELRIDKNGQRDMSANYQVQEYYMMNLREVPDDKQPAEVAIELFTELFEGSGMSNADALTSATNLVNTELDFTPATFIDFARLVNGHNEGEGKNRTFVESTAAEQAIAAKVMRMLQARSKRELADLDPLTEEEANQVIESKYKLVVKKGFLQRVCAYVHTIEQLQSVFKVMRPKRFPSQVKFAASDTPDERNRRLLAEAKDILGVK